MTQLLEIGATALGLVQGALIMLNKRSNWIFYSLQMAFLVAFSAVSHLYGDMVNNSIYFFIGLIGFVLWNKKAALPIRASSAVERTVCLAVILLGSALVFLFLRTTDDPLPLLDAFTTVSSLVATYLMLMRRIDTWGVWLVNDIAYIVEYYLLPDRAVYLLLLNVVWTAMAVLSLFNWRRIMRKEGTR